MYVLGPPHRRPDTAGGIGIVISGRDDDGFSVSRKRITNERERVGADVTAVEKVARDEQHIVTARQLDDVYKDVTKFIAKPLSRRKIDPGEGRIEVKVAGM
jgi:hypothetical protein